MKLLKRIKRIVSLTVDDFYNSGKSTNETKESLVSWLCDALMQNENIEDNTTIELSLQVLNMLKSLDIVDLEYIHNVVFKDIEQTKISIVFDGVAL